MRLFGWHWRAAADRWMTPDEEPVLAEDLPAYTTDPAATALVWQWVEGHGMEDLSFHYDHPPDVGCQITYTLPGDEGYHYVFTVGPTWPEALCRAALQLAEQWEKGTR